MMTTHHERRLELSSKAAEILYLLHFAIQRQKMTEIFACETNRLTF